ncbi:three-helix bundle dimerization domain-containing protein [Rhodococcus sp. NPDC003348]
MGDDEAKQIDHVIERLITRHPSFRPADVEAVVRRIHARFTDSRIRDFIPLLVEKAARREFETGPPVVMASIVVAPTSDPPPRPMTAVPVTGTVSLPPTAQAV